MLHNAVKLVAVTIVATLLCGLVLLQASASASIVSQPELYAVGIAYDAQGNGGWIAAQEGAVIPFGSAQSLGGESGITLNAPIVGIAATPDANGYWLVGADGGVFAFGDAGYYGSIPELGLALNAPIVGITPTPDGKGYWLVGADGGVFTFGDAQFYGRTYYQPTPTVGIAGISTQDGYQIVQADGSTTAFEYLKGGGGTAFPLNAPIVGIVSDPAVPSGYWFVAADGGVFSLGAPFYGSLGGEPWFSATTPIVGMAVNPSGQCYSMVNDQFTVFTFCNPAGQQVDPDA